MSICTRPCRFRTSDSAKYTERNGCDYIGATGRSRVKRVYEILGVDRMTPEARELLEPENCPCFLPGERERRIVEFNRDNAEFHPARRLKDFDDRMKLYLEGKSDVEIGKLCGVWARTIQGWRGRRGLPPNYPPRKKREGETDAETV